MKKQPIVEIPSYVLLVGFLFFMYYVFVNVFIGIIIFLVAAFLYPVEYKLRKKFFSKKK